MEKHLAEMKKDVEANEEKDKAEKERIDKINAADSNIFATEKQLKEYGDKLPADKKSAIEGALAKLKEAHKNADVAAIDTAIAELNAAIDALAPRIPQLKKELETAQSSQKELDAALSQLDKAQSQLETGKLELSQQLILATLQLQQAEQALDEAEEQFRQQRDAAYKAAGLDGILTQSAVSQLLMAQNFSMPAGYIQSDEGQLALKVGDKFTSLEELQNWVLFQYDVGDVGEICLTDIATVRLADNAEELYAKINGNDGVLLTVQKSSIASTSGACDNLYAAMAQLEEKYDGLHLTALSDQGQYIDLVISSVLENLLFGALLAVIVLMLFLRDFRPTIIVALSIPISLLLAVVLMHFTGVTLNIISLSGLALGVGMLVDNSIVAIENIYRLRQLGYNAATAAVHGCRQIAGAITASTLTTVCVFVPILFTSGLTRQIFADMGLTIAYSLGASLLVALTLVPALSGKILTRDTAGEKPNRLLNRMIAGYEKLLRQLVPGVEITARACPLFVPLVEAGYVDHSEAGKQQITKLVIAQYLTEVREAGVDTLILGCTHYPLLKSMIGEFMGPGVTLVDPAMTAAHHLERMLAERGLRASHESGQAHFYVSDVPDSFVQTADLFLGEYKGGPVEQIAIDKY